MSLINSLKTIQRELDKAGEYLLKLPQMPDLDAYIDCWGDFLQHLDRAWNHMLQANIILKKGVKEVSEAEKLRNHRSPNADPLLSYLKIARNHNEHGRYGLIELKEPNITFSSKRDTSMASLQFNIDPTGQLLGVNFFNEEGVDVSDHFNILEVQSGPLLQLGVVEDVNNKPIQPPRSHLGIQINPADVYKSGELGLKYYRNLFSNIISAAGYTSSKSRIQKIFGKTTN